MKTIFQEDQFRQLLAMERRRCERLESRFAVVLVQMEALNGSLRSEVATEIALAVDGAMRDTDIIGWFRHLTTVGVILTTLNGDRPVIEQAVVKRIAGVLSARLNDEQMNKVSFSCQVFPEDEGGAFDDRGGTRISVSAVLKRTVDLLGSLTALMILAPVFLVIAVLIKLTSPGPVFFKQRRVGQWGREFTFLKFRSMIANCDPAIHQQYVTDLIQNKARDSGTFKITNDPRVTRIGRFIRKTSLDELPQFINTLRGDMSLVGPRPPIPYELATYSRWHRRRVLEAKPGITGPWQVDGRSRTTFDEMVRMDLRYIRERSLWLDLKILLRTPLAVLRGSGAY